jgi:hypothetical protein
MNSPACFSLLDAGEAVTEVTVSNTTSILLLDARSEVVADHPGSINNDKGGGRDVARGKGESKQLNKLFQPNHMPSQPNLPLGSNPPTCG